MKGRILSKSLSRKKTRMNETYILPKLESEKSWKNSFFFGGGEIR